MTFIKSLAGALVLAAASPAASQTLRAADVAASVGVNVHMEYRDSAYADVSRALAALKYLGVSLVRDAAPDPYNQAMPSYIPLARAGVRFDLVVNGSEISTAISGLTVLESRYPGAVHSIEGPNEINNHASFSFAGLTDRHRAATAYQTALYSAVKTNPILRAIPVLAFTDYPVTPGPCDVANFHAYPDGRGPAGARLTEDADAALAVAPGKPLIDTEFGYFTQPIRGALSQKAQARLILSGLLDNAARGVRETYIYQLLDAYSDPAATDNQKHFGLFDINDRPKTAAQMLRRFSQALQDKASAARSFPIRFEGVTIQGLPASARTLVIEKASGETLIAVWNETPVWDAAREIDLEGPKFNLTLETGAPHRAASIIDLVDGTVAETGASGPIRLSLGASPLIVRLSAN
jgi:hypothetical protein